MTLCPSDFALDDLELHAADDTHELTAHLAGCSRCAARVAERAAIRGRFAPRPAAVMWAELARRDVAPRRRWLRRLALPLACASAAAVALVVVRPVDDPPPRVLAKGGSAVEVICRRAGRVFALAPGQGLATGDEVRLRLSGAPAAARFVVAGSVDGTGRYSPFFPPGLADQSLALPPPGEPLPGAVTIDAQAGPERVVVVLSSTPLRVADVARAAEAHAGGGGLSEVAGVPVWGSWLVLDKSVR